MIKTILIPTDFKVESLNTLKHALQDNAIFELEVILLHSEILSDSITDLLFYSAESIIKPLLTPTFEEALSFIRTNFKEIKSLSLEVTHSNNEEAIKQLLLSKKVDEIIIPKTYKLQLTKKAFDSIPLLKKSGFPVHEVEWDLGSFDTEKLLLQELFKSH